MIECIIASPPYGDQQVGTGGEGRTGWRGYTDHGGGTIATPGQLAAMPSGVFPFTEDPMNQKEDRVGVLPTITFDNCYDDSWKDAIVPEAFAHP